VIAMTSSDLVLCSLLNNDPIPVLFVSAQSVEPSPTCIYDNALTCAEAIEMLRRYSYPVVVTDQTLPDGTWLNILHAGDTQFNPPQVIVLGAAGDHQFWANALLSGALDVLCRPLKEESLAADVAAGYRRWIRSAELIEAQAAIIQAACQQRVIPITLARVAANAPAAARKVIWREQTRVLAQRTVSQSA
jgi:response regulator of citrate/malate metabolism